jgi:hypothetical protein
VIIFEEKYRISEIVVASADSGRLQKALVGLAIPPTK